LVKETGIIWIRAELAFRHLAQRAVERFRPEEERAVQHDAVDIAL